MQFAQIFEKKKKQCIKIWSQKEITLSLIAFVKVVKAYSRNTEKSHIYIYSTFSKASPSRLFHQPLDLLLTNLVKTKLPFHLYSRLYLGPLKSTKVAIFKEPTRRGRKKKDDEEGKRRGGVFGSKRGNLVPRFSLFPFFILFIYSLLPSV